MIQGLLDGETPEQLLAHADPRLKATPDELREALEGDLSEKHRVVTCALWVFANSCRIFRRDELEARILRFRQTLLS
jgi:hypothetical protein